MILDLEIGPKSSRKSSFSKSFEEGVSEAMQTGREPEGGIGAQRFATV